MEFQVFRDATELGRVAADLLIGCARYAVELRGRFTIALSGGSTPGYIFDALVAAGADSMPWGRTIIFWGDDRVVPPDHEWSNYRLAKERLLDHVPVPEENVFRIQGELDAPAAAAAMRVDLESVFGSDETPRFDFALQGMGTDGHTASLFPGTDALQSEDWVVPVIAPPANPAVDRVTLTFPVLNASRLALFLAAGESKRDLMNAIVNDPTAVERYPAARVEAERTIWFTDEAAFGGVR